MSEGGGVAARFNHVVQHAGSKERTVLDNDAGVDEHSRYKVGKKGCGEEACHRDCGVGGSSVEHVGSV